MTRQSFLHGAFVLVAAALVTRILGFVYRIFLTRLIGAEGMGLFQMVFPLLSLVLTFVTAGLPTAISKLVAEAMVQRDRVRVQRILRVSATVILSMAFVFTSLMWALRGVVLHHWLTDQRAYPAYLAMIPVVAIIAVSSIYRGYFQGLQLMSPPAVASIVETVVRIGSIWFLATYFLQYGLAYAAAAAMGGMVIGEFAGFLILLWNHHRSGRLDIVLPDAPTRSLETTRQTLRAIGELAIPVTLSRLIGSLMWAVEPVLVTRSLAMAGAATAAATTMYGQYSGMAIPLLVFPTVFTGSLAVNLVPSISEAMVGREQARVRMRLTQSWRITALVGFPTTVVLTVLAAPLCRVLFHAPSAGPILAVMAPTGFLLYLQAPLGGILQGMNKAGVAMINSVIGGLVRLGAIYWLASSPHLKILGVAWATNLSVTITTALHFVAVYRRVGFSVRTADTAKMGVASLLMLILLEILKHTTGQMSAEELLEAVVISLSVYFVLLCSFRVLTTRNVSRVPKVGSWLRRIVAAMPFSV